MGNEERLGETARKHTLAAHVERETLRGTDARQVRATAARCLCPPRPQAQRRPLPPSAARAGVVGRMRCERDAAVLPLPLLPVGDGLRPRLRNRPAKRSSIARERMLPKNDGSNSLRGHVKRKRPCASCWQVFERAQVILCTIAATGRLIREWAVTNRPLRVHTVRAHGELSWCNVRRC